MRHITKLIHKLYTELKNTLKYIIKTSDQPAICLARGAGLGMFITLTPTVGIQVPVLILLWYLSKHFRIYRFNFKIAFTLTWITNYITAVPFYFLFYIIGVSIGNTFFNWKSPIDYQGFTKLWEPVFHNTFRDALSQLGTVLFRIGGPLFLGCIPLALPISIISYYITLKMVVYYRKKHGDICPSDNSKP